MDKQTDAVVRQLRANQQTPREVCSARELYKGLLKRIDDGEFNPYRKRLTEHEKIAMHKQLITDRGIRYAACSLENFEIEYESQLKAVKALRGFLCDLGAHLVQTNGGGLILIGPPGTGKDHLMMAAMTTAILDHGLSVV